MGVFSQRFTLHFCAFFAMQGVFSLRFFTFFRCRAFFVVYFTLQDVFTLRISHRRTFLVVYFTLQDVFTLRISHRRAFFRCGFYIRMFLHCAVSLHDVFSFRIFIASRFSLCILHCMMFLHCVVSLQGVFSLCIRCYVARFASNSYTKYNKISLNNVLLIICTEKSHVSTTWSTHHEPHMYTTRHTTLTLCRTYIQIHTTIYT